jgi:hypothetical protein
MDAQISRARFTWRLFRDAVLFQSMVASLLLFMQVQGVGEEAVSDDLEQKATAQGFSDLISDLHINIAVHAQCCNKQIIQVVDTLGSNINPELREAENSLVVEVGRIPVASNGMGGFVGHVDEKVHMNNVGQVRVRCTLDMQPIEGEERRMRVKCRDLKVSMQADVLRKKKREEETTQKTIKVKGVSRRHAEFSVLHKDTIEGVFFSVEPPADERLTLQHVLAPISVRIPISVTLTENAGNCLFWCLRRPKLEGTLIISRGQVVPRGSSGETGEVFILN